MACESVPDREIASPRNRSPPVWTGRGDGGRLWKSTPTPTRPALAINSARTDLAKLEYVPPDNQQLIGQTHERVKGQGVGADPELGAEVARQDRHELERSLVVVAGPTDEFSRKGLERARQWVEEETESMDVLAGDSPQPSVDRLSAVVALSNPTNVQRVDELQGLAVDAKGNMQAQEEARDDAIQDLITDDAGELDPI